jgi:rhamnose transport system ATP-binding protein
VLLISSELPEVLTLADRILVMREGRVVGELDHTEAAPERIMHLAVGEVGARA